MLLHTILGFLVLLPFYMNSGIGDGIRTPKEMLSLLGFVSICLVGLNYYKRPCKTKSLLWFLLWAVFTTFIFNNYSLPYVFGYVKTNVVYLAPVMNDIRLNTPLMLLAWKSLFYITLTVFTVYTISSCNFKQAFRYNVCGLDINNQGFCNKEILTNICKAVSLVICLLGIYSIVQAVGLDSIFKAVSPFGQKAVTNLDQRFSFTHRVVATIGNPSLLGSFIAICLPVTLYGACERIKIAMVATVIGLITIAMTGSATAIIAISATLLFLLFRYRLKAVLIAIILLLLSSALVFHAFKEVDGFESKVKHKVNCFINPTGRIETHKEAWEIMKDRGLIGCGLGSFEYLIGNNPEVIKRLQGERWKQLHDEPGQLFMELGLPGIIIFLFLIFIVTRLFIRNFNNETSALYCSLLGFMIISLTLFPMRVAPHSFYGVIFLGLFLNITGGEEKT